MSAFSKISLGRPTKRYTHNMSFDNNTTFDFGGVQPTLLQYMEGDDSFQLDVRQFLRLAPLPLPTYGRVHLQNEFRFVPITDVCPYYEALLAEQPYFGSNGGMYHPTTVPYTCNRDLVQFLCLNYCDFNVLIQDPSSSFGSLGYQYASNDVPNSCLDPSDSGDLSQLNTLLSDYWQGPIANMGALKSSSFEKLTYEADAVHSGTFGPYIPPSSRPNPTDGQTYSTITIDSADFVIPVSTQYIFLFRLNSAGRRLRKIFIGCGFSLSILDTEPLSLLPLLAFYKAYFDVYAPKREVTWSSTRSYSLIKYIEDNYYVDFSNFTNDPDDSGFTLFIDFLRDLSDCWYSQLDDFVSANRSMPVTVNRSFISPDGDASQTISNDINDPGSELPYQSIGSNINSLTLQMIRLVGRFVNKDSVIGGKLSDWLKVHYGADVSNSLFKDSNNIGSFSVESEINSIFSTSDTATSEGGDVLGSFAGAGIGKNSSKFSFKAPSFGYAIMLSCIVPESGYFQGNDPQLYLLTRDNIPFPEYDALGYEVTPKSMIYDDRGVAKAYSSGGFGFVPRYSSLKRKRNIVNGDMSRRGSIDSYSGYYLDRIIGQSEVSSVPMSDGSVQLEIHTADIPTASEEWRYPTKYPWLGNPNRIFYQSGTLYKGVGYDGDELIDDNFTCDMTFDFKLTNKYKPISQSYDTYDESVDDGSIDVTMD